MTPLSFRNSRIVFATNHRKAQVAVEPFRRALGSEIEELAIDSDRLGTFSGEIERPGTMLDALRGKVQLARKEADSRFVLTSEGSFGGAGGFSLVAQGIELLMLHDSITGVEVIEQYVSWDTNYATSVVTTEQQLLELLKRINFGSHGVILYPQGLLVAENVRKDFASLDEVRECFNVSQALSPQGGVVVMSDMRAHRNPTRMSAIRACCELLATRLATQCERCASGGFGLVASIPGLPCARCGFPTQRAKGEEHGCVVCGARVERARSDGKLHAEPHECEVCNP
jgi:hypothetical protein